MRRTVVFCLAMLAAAGVCLSPGLGLQQAEAGKKGDFGAPPRAAGNDEQADAAAPMPPVEAVELTPSLVDRFIQGMDAVITIAREHGLHRLAEEAKDGSDPAAAMVRRLRASGAGARVRQVLQGVGFERYHEWRNVAVSTMAAYAYAKSGTDPRAMQGQMRQAMQQIMNNPNISQAQKDEIRRKMAQAEAQQAAAAPSPNNLAVVRGKLDDLDALTERMRAMSAEN